MQLDLCSYGCITLYCSSGSEEDLWAEVGAILLAVAQIYIGLCEMRSPDFCQFLVNNSEEKHAVGNTFESPCACGVPVGLQP